jgi:hypothetical protein
MLQVSVTLYYEYVSLLKDNAVLPVESLPTLLDTSFHAGFFLGCFFNPEDGGDIFLRKVS